MEYFRFRTNKQEFELELIANLRQLWHTIESMELETIFCDSYPSLPWGITASQPFVTPWSAGCNAQMSFLFQGQTTQLTYADGSILIVHLPKLLLCSWTSRIHFHVRFQHMNQLCRIAFWIKIKNHSVFLGHFDKKSSFTIYY